MNVIAHKSATAIVLAASALTSTSALAMSGSPAWLEPGYVMEEVVATAPRPASAQALAWQADGYVMEEVVATAARPGAPAWTESGYVMEEVVATATRDTRGAQHTAADLPSAWQARREHRRERIRAFRAGVRDAVRARRETVTG